MGGAEGVGKQKRLCTVIETKRGKKEREGSGGEIEGEGREEGGWRRDEPAKKMTADETGAREGGSDFRRAERKSSNWTYQTAAGDPSNLIFAVHVTSTVELLKSRVHAQLNR